MYGYGFRMPAGGVIGAKGAWNPGVEEGLLGAFLCSQSGMSVAANRAKGASGGAFVGEPVEEDDGLIVNASAHIDTGLFDPASGAFTWTGRNLDTLETTAAEPTLMGNYVSGNNGAGASLFMDGPSTLNATIRILTNGVSGALQPTLTGVNLDEPGCYMLIFGVAGAQILDLSHNRAGAFVSSPAGTSARILGSTSIKIGSGGPGGNHAGTSKVGTALVHGIIPNPVQRAIIYRRQKISAARRGVDVSGWV